MATRYIGKARMEITYNSRQVCYEGVVCAPGYTWRFKLVEPKYDQLPPRHGHPTKKAAYDSPETYDLMASVAASFATNSDHEDPPRDVAQGLADAFEPAMDHDGTYMVKRNKRATAYIKPVRSAPITQTPEPLIFKLQLYQNKYLVLGWKNSFNGVWLTSLYSPEGEVEPGSVRPSTITKEEFLALPWVNLQVVK